MGSLALTQENLDNQREVVKNERRQRYDNVPYGRWAEILLSLAFPEGHPYHHSTIGSMAELDSAQQSDFSAFYEAYYSPDNAVLTVVGDADAAQVRALAREYFGGLTPRPRPEPPTVSELPASIDGPVHEVVTEPVPLPRFFFGFRATRFGRPGAAAEEMLATVLGRGRGARLFAELVTRRELAQAEGGYLASWQLAWHESLLTGMATPRPGVEPADLAAAYFEVCENAITQPPTESELDRARSMLAADWARELSTVGSRADQLGRHAVLFGDAETVRARLTEITAVTAEEVRAAAERIFTPANRVTLEYRVAAAETAETAGSAATPTTEGN
jgi:predicted Zn-dependent peptidase